MKLKHSHFHVCTPDINKRALFAGGLINFCVFLEVLIRTNCRTPWRILSSKKCCQEYSLHFTDTIKNELNALLFLEVCVCVCYGGIFDLVEFSSLSFSQPGDINQVEIPTLFRIICIRQIIYQLCYVVTFTAGFGAKMRGEMFCFRACL